MILTFLPTVALSQTSKLRESVEVSHAVIRLSDLLPGNISVEIRQAAERVELGRAPQPGTARVLNAEFISRKLADVPSLGFSISIPDEIVVRRAAWPMEDAAIQDAIRRYLQREGWALPFSDNESFLGNKPAIAQAHATVEVQDLRWNEQQKVVQVELRCTQRELCREFMVQFVLPSVAIEAWRHQLCSLQSQAGIPPMQKDTDDNNDEVTRAGQRAVVVWQEDGMKMSLPVICLERGHQQQRIRVLNAETHKTFRAEVVNAHLLRACAQKDETTPAIGKTDAIHQEMVIQQ